MDINSIKKKKKDSPCFINQANFCIKSISLDVYTDITPHTGRFIPWFIKRIKEISKNDGKRKTKLLIDIMNILYFFIFHLFFFLFEYEKSK